MHEMSLCESLLGILEQEAEAQNFKRVKIVRLQVGAMSCAAPEALDFCFRTVSNGTIAHGARLELHRTPGRAWCMNCGETVPVLERYDPCPQCGGYELQVTGGDEMRIKDLEVE